MRVQMLRKIYDQAAGGLPLLGTPEEVAAHFRRETDAHGEAADHLIQRYVMLCGTTGFVLGLPGYVTMPVTVPTNVAGVLLLQFHLCAALAVLGGKDPQEASVRERSVGCVLGSHEEDGSRLGASDEDETQGLLSRLGTKLGERGVRLLGEQATRWIGRAASQAGRGARSLPLLGGAVGGVADGYSTREVGRRAQRAFLSAPVA